MTTDLTIVIPIYNEVENIKYSYDLIKDAFNKENLNPTIIYINDGSDNKETLSMLNLISQKKNVLVYSNNHQGQQAAIASGLSIASTKYIAVMDCDMQDLPKYLYNMYELIKRNPDIDCFIGSRKETKILSVRNVCSFLYYKFLSIYLRKKVARGNNFYILRRECLPKLNELYIPGSIHAKLNYKLFYYKRINRKYGKSKYNFRKLIKLAITIPKYYK